MLVTKVSIAIKGTPVWAVLGVLGVLRGLSLPLIKENL
jgi:hypothetical protein